MNIKIITFFILIFLVFWNFLKIGPRVANDFHFLYPETGKQLFSLPFAWRDVITAEGLGEYSVATLWSWPLNLIYGFFSMLGVDFSITTLIVGVILFLFLACVGMFRLFDRYKISDWGKYIGTFFFVCNTYLLLLLDGGQINLVLSYGLLPLNFNFLLGFLDKKNNKFWSLESLLFVFSVLAISFLDFRILYLLVILIFIKFLFDCLFNYKQIVEIFKSYFGLGAVTSLFILGFHAYWLLPTFLAKAPALPSGYERLDQINFLSFSTISHSLFLLSPHWYRNIFGVVSEIKWEFGFIPVLAFLSPVIIRKRDLRVSFWILMALLGIFLSKGSKPPFPEFYGFLFKYVPGFSLFRDPVKFFHLIALSYSVLIGFTVEELMKLGTRFSKLFLFVPAILLLYLVFLVRPAYLLQMTGIFSTPANLSEYSDFARLIGKDTNFSRVFWIPTKAPLGYSSLIHPAVEAVRLSDKRPFSTGVVGSYETLNYIREASYMGELFDVSGIKYLAYPFLDPKKQLIKPDNVEYYYKFLNQISSLNWIEGKVDESKIPLLKTKSHQDKFFLTNNLWMVVGSDDIYKEATKSPDLKLANNSLVFLEETAGLGRKIQEYPEAKINLNNKTETDLAASFLDKKNLIFPSQKMGFEPDKNGWWKREASDLVWLRNFLNTKYGVDDQDFDLGGGYAMAEGNLNLDLKLPGFNNKKVLLARVFESTKSGEIRFNLGKGKSVAIDTKKEGNKFGWYDLGEINPTSETLHVLTSGGVNILNAIGLVDSQEWAQKKELARDLKQSGRIAEYKEENVLKASSAKVSYVEVNPTKYKVNIQGLAGSEYLVFSESFDRLWKLNGHEPLPVYSFLNGYEVDKDGEYILEYEPQKFVDLGIKISFLTSVIFIFFLIRSFRKTY